MTTVRAILANSATAISAQAIARAAGLPIEEAYAELVAMEARGLARVVVQFRHQGAPEEKLWERGHEMENT